MTLFSVLLIVAVLAAVGFGAMGYFAIKRERKPWLIAVGVSSVLAIFFVICMFNIETHVVYPSDYLLNFKSAKQRVGKYSEVVVEPCTRTDSKGRSYTTTCTYTEYWEEPCSKVYYIQMRKHTLTYQSDPEIELIKDSFGFVYPADPPQEWDIPQYNLDRIVVEHSTDYTLLLRIKGVWFSNPISRQRYLEVMKDIKAERCIVAEELWGWIVSNETMPASEAPIVDDVYGDTSDRFGKRGGTY